MPLRSPSRLSAFRSGFIPTLARLCILASFPVSLFWYPLMKVEGVGTVTVGDGLFCLLWALVAATIVLQARIPSGDQLPGTIVLLAFYLALCAALGAASSGGANTPGRELVQFLKRFGFAAILPLAMSMFASRGLRRASAVLLFLSILAMTVFVLFPELRTLLPIYSSREDVDLLATLSVRPTGMITNPNDLAYFSVIALALLLALLRPRSRGSYAAVAVGGIAAAAALTSTILSGSRSGVAGLVAGAAFYVIRGRRNAVHKALLILLIVGVGLVGWRSSEEFQDRMARAVEFGVKEDNLAARLEAQGTALKASVDHPFGVGYGNFGGLTPGAGAGTAFTQLLGSDSMYLDTLLGAGFIGLALLVWILVVSWRCLRALARDNPAATDFLSFGFVAAVTFGFATVSPMSVFVSPIFFFLIGAAALLRAEFPARPGPRFRGRLPARARLR